jgi:2-polyprenyl-3-methyl-5-hydroxy-6-metoxy-1,4-benzoquinol methylase
MCNTACIAFAAERLSAEEVSGKTVLEVGARNVNGSVRETIEAMGPAAYTGVDIAEGPGVDKLCDVRSLIATFGPSSFDLVVTTELIEHVEDWRLALHNLKSVLRADGTIMVTTRSEGFPRHEWPGDFWRYSVLDMAVIFSDFHIQVIEQDPFDIGVFLKARKRPQWVPANLDSHHLFRVV